MKIKRIEHVGVLVKDVDKSRALWEGCFGIKLDAVETNPVRPVKLALYPVGESMVELIAGTTPDSKHAKMIAEGKGGINHICFEVESIDEALAELKAKGVPLLDPGWPSPWPVPGATRRGRMTAPASWSGMCRASRSDVAAGHQYRHLLFLSPIIAVNSRASPTSPWRTGISG